LPTAIDALLIGVTEFFRDPPVFEALRIEVLPELASLPRPLRVWSAGCSNGAELYSLAMLLAKAGLLEGSFLLGSDCRRDAIEHARAALYNSSELRNIEPSDRRRYFDEAGSFWQPIELLRRHVQWKVADLARGIEEGPWDIILWRNMAIYLKVEAAASVWRGLALAMAPEGMLIVGKAERPPTALPLIHVRRCIYRYCSREGGRAFGLRPRQTSHSHPKTLEAFI
jgi:chemotaxis methyl-accepting protein methylase